MSKKCKQVAKCAKIEWGSLRMRRWYRFDHGVHYRSDSVMRSKAYNAAYRMRCKARVKQVDGFFLVKFYRPKLQVNNA